MSKYDCRDSNHPCYERRVVKVAEIRTSGPHPIVRFFPGQGHDAVKYAPQDHRSEQRDEEDFGSRMILTAIHSIEKVNCWSLAGLIGNSLLSIR
jgi:hypothetical protein